MKLQVKHLAPYLSYRLKWQVVTHYVGCATDTLIDEMIACFSNEDLILLSDAGDCYSDNEGRSWGSDDFIAKPILRPLSDLDKLVDLGGMRLIATSELKELYNSINSTELTELNFYHTPEDGFCFFGVANQFEDVKEVGMPLYMYENIFRWHFDVFGLIEQGLAIDINTLPATTIAV